jgi:hypothetical protein
LGKVCKECGNDECEDIVDDLCCLCGDDDEICDTCAEIEDEEEDEEEPQSTTDPNETARIRDVIWQHLHEGWKAFQSNNTRELQMHVHAAESIWDDIMNAEERSQSLDIQNFIAFMKQEITRKTQEQIPKPPQPIQAIVVDK